MIFSFAKSTKISRNCPEAAGFSGAVTSYGATASHEASGSHKPSISHKTAERLLNEYGSSILRIAYSYLHNRSDAEDILQETMIRYLQAAPDFQSPAHEKAWLLKVAANLCKNRLNYERIRETDELHEELTAEHREDLAFVWEAVSSLPVKYREVIHLFYHEGYSTAEISGLLDRKESTVRSDLRRGRQKLKEILKEAYDFE